MNLVFEGFGRDERVTEDRSQWFTPSPIATRMVKWAGDIKPARILEPSAGGGNLVAAARGRWASAEITACELDPHYVDRLGQSFAEDRGVRVLAGDYRSVRHESRFDLGIANPPYEDGLDGEFLAKMMGECDRVIALVRLVCLAGLGRYEGVWRNVGTEWRMPGLAIFSGRPEFEAGRAVGVRKEGESAKADFCVVKLSRSEICSTTSTEVEWW